MPRWAAEIEVDEDLARTLILGAFPTLAAGSLERLGVGWDNVVWATEDGVAFRFPRRQAAIPGLEREMAVLPRLHGQLPLSVPDARYLGSPGPQFPWPWFGSTLIAGSELAEADLDAPALSALAEALARFLRRLHHHSRTNLPPLPLDPMRRLDMSLRVRQTRRALESITDLWPDPSDVAEAVLETAALLPYPTGSCLVHGDLHMRHLLIGEGHRLVGVIDWGDVCLAHPAADLSLYWSSLPPVARTRFLETYGPLDAEALLRARVLSLFLCVTLADYARVEGFKGLLEAAVRGLQLTLVD